MEETKTVLSVQKPTPAWATWMFRIFYHLTTAFAIWLATTKVVPEVSKFEALLAASALDRVVWGIARGLGVSKKNLSQESNEDA